MLDRFGRYSWPLSAATVARELKAEADAHDEPVAAEHTASEHELAVALAELCEGPEE